MPSTDMLKIVMLVALGLFAVIVIAYIFLRKAMNKSEYRKIKQLQEGVQENTHSSEILYQKLYVKYTRIPFLKRYILKLRRRLEILNIDDEYATRRDSSKILTRALTIIGIIVIITIIFAHSSTLLMLALLLFELFMLDTFIDSMVDKLDNNLLREQVEFFSEIRHAYHEFNMVEEAIYQVSLDDEKNISKQGEKIYEVLISDDPETELEKYYDIAPNSYLKEFAGVSYLTKEFGDRKINGASLYLKNIDNITQEMQLEILKRDKLSYVFQSLPIISIAPIVLLEPLKKWSVSNFAFTESFYSGKGGMIVQILIMILTFVCYILVRKLKDNGSTQVNTGNTQNPWQSKVYKNPIGKKIVDLFTPKQGTKDYRKMIQLMKDSATNQKMEWIYVNRLTITIVTFFASLILMLYLHTVAINYIYTQPTSEYNLLGNMSASQEAQAMSVTEKHNYFLDIFKGQKDVTTQKIQVRMRQSEYYKDETDEVITADSQKIYDKLQIINREGLQWYDILIAFVLAIAGYMVPIALLYFQKIMRKLEMEDEVMQYQTIITMLMKIERVNVEIILEWLERYSNIFREPISRCVNNYEAGAWESLEELRNSVSYEPLIRIVESLQAAVEKIPIADAFDELDSEREYYQAKRKESNDRLVARKQRIGQVIGFAPMIVTFVGYLIVPLVVIGFKAMGTTMAEMMKMK